MKRLTKLNSDKNIYVPGNLSDKYCEIFYNLFYSVGEAFYKRKLWCITIMTIYVDRFYVLVWRLRLQNVVILQYNWDSDLMFQSGWLVSSITYGLH